MTPTDDECYVSIEVYDNFLHEKFKKMVGCKFDEEEVDGDLMRLVGYKAPYCQIEEVLRDCARLGMVFSGGHGSGNLGYPEGLFCSFNGKFYAIDTINDEPVVTVLPNGNINQENLNEVRDYLKAMKKINEVTGG